MINVTLILKGYPQERVQRGQITEGTRGKVKSMKMKLIPMDPEQAESCDFLPISLNEISHDPNSNMEDLQHISISTSSSFKVSNNENSLVVVGSGCSAARGTASYEFRHCCILFLSYIKLHDIGEIVLELNKTKYFIIVKI